MSRLLSALGIGAAGALATAIVSLLIATLVIGTDRAVLGALAVALSGGAVATLVAWCRIGPRSQPRVAPPPRPMDR